MTLTNKKITNNPILDIFKNTNKKIPIWFMRQAGRHLPEYLEIRNKADNFLDFCYNSSLAFEATIQPLKRYDIDSVIIFSDILVIPDALGLNVSFVKNKGPVLDKIKNKQDIENLNFDVSKLEPVYKAIKMVDDYIPENKGLIGFVGAPWTLISYMIEGGSSKDFNIAKKFFYQKRDLYNQLQNILVEALFVHIEKQILSGAKIIQIFDSWAGSLNENEFYECVILPTKYLVEKVKNKYSNIPIIGFPRKAGFYYKDYLETNVDAISIDQNVPLDWAKNNLPCIIQGNLDPNLLAFDVDSAIVETKKILKNLEEKSFIFNLGHGVLPETPIENVKKIISLVNNYNG